MIVRWNGTAWKPVPSPSPAGGQLRAVAATSAASAWAVGGNSLGPLILRWNGSAWKKVPSPSVPAGTIFGVAAVSSRDAWAVGDIQNSDRPTSLILHWKGTAWRRVTGLGTVTALLGGVTAVSSVGVWAVGDSYTCAPPPPVSHLKALIVRWNGTAEAGAQPEPLQQQPGRHDGHLRPERLGGRRLLHIALRSRLGGHAGADPALEREHLEMTSPRRAAPEDFRCRLLVSLMR